MSLGTAERWRVNFLDHVARQRFGWRSMPTTDDACPGDQGRGGEPFWNQVGRSASIAPIDCTLEKLCEARH